MSEKTADVIPLPRAPSPEEAAEVFRAGVVREHTLAPDPEAAARLPERTLSWRYDDPGAPGSQYDGNAPEHLPEASSVGYDALVGRDGRTAPGIVLRDARGNALAAARLDYEVLLGLADYIVGNAIPWGEHVAREGDARTVAGHAELRRTLARTLVYAEHGEIREEARLRALERIEPELEELRTRVRDDALRDAREAAAKAKAEAEAEARAEHRTRIRELASAAAEPDAQLRDAMLRELLPWLRSTCGS